MINLEKLDDEIADALAQETPESLTKWLDSKRKPLTIEERILEMSFIANPNSTGYRVTDYKTAVRIAKEYAEGKCKWIADDEEEPTYFETSCGNAFQFSNDGIKENNANFCIYCGGKIVATDEE